MEDLDSLDKFSLVHISREIGAECLMRDSKDYIIDKILEKKEEIRKLTFKNGVSSVDLRSTHPDGVEESYPVKANVVLPSLVIDYGTDSIKNIKESKCKLHSELVSYSPDSLTEICEMLGHTIERRGKFCLINDIAVDSARTLLNYMLFLENKIKSYNPEEHISDMGKLREAAKAIFDFRELRKQLISEIEVMSTDVVVQIGKNLGYTIKWVGKYLFINGKPVNDKRTLVLLMCA